jgi:hypothetical protein
MVALAWGEVTGVPPLAAVAVARLVTEPLSRSPWVIK